MVDRKKKREKKWVEFCDNLSYSTPHTFSQITINTRVSNSTIHLIFTKKCNTNAKIKIRIKHAKNKKKNKTNKKQKTKNKKIYIFFILTKHESNKGYQ